MEAQSKGAIVRPTQPGATASSKLYLLPPVIVLDSAKPLIADAITRQLLSSVYHLLEHEATKNAITVKRVDVVGANDLDEGTSNIIVRQWIDAAADTALAYWDKVDKRFGEWVESLSDDLHAIAAEHIFIFVEW